MKESFDTVVLGGGTAGAAVAGILAERTERRILLVEAGPDYGALDEGRWPADLLDARQIPWTHDWGYDSGDRYPGRVLPFERAKVIGGCSSHNGCTVTWGHRSDYDGWAAEGLVGWSADELLPLFRAASERSQVRRYTRDECSPFQEAFLDAFPGVGVPAVQDLNDLDGGPGVAPMSANIEGGVRFNAAFAYLDPVRDRRTFTIWGDAPVDRVLLEGTRVVGVRLIIDDHPQDVGADRIVVSAGAYGTPAILLRSGIGPADQLRHLGIEPVVDLPGVGANLHDHPILELRYAATPELIAATEAFEASHDLMPAEQVVAKARSAQSDEAFDLHVFPEFDRDPDGPDGWHWVVPSGLVAPRSRGRLTLRDADPASPPVFDHAYLSDPEGHDVDAVLDGVEMIREVMDQPAFRGLIREEVRPGPELGDRAALRGFLLANVQHYWHPVGTCAMGAEGAPGAVADARGAVQGVDGLFVADASAIPVTPRATTNLPVQVVGERIGRWLAEA